MLIAVVASPKPECANAPRAYLGRLQYTLSLTMYPILPTPPQIAVDRRGSHRLAGEMYAYVLSLKGALLPYLQAICRIFGGLPPNVSSSLELSSSQSIDQLRTSSNSGSSRLGHAP